MAFSHHRPRLAAADLAFFSLADDEGFKSTLLFTKDVPKVDLGDAGHVRAVVDPELGNVSSSLVYVYALHRRGLK